MPAAIGGAGALNVAVPFVDVMSPGTGVVGDGVTDDAAAIQKVINNNPGRTIYFPRRVQGSGRDASGNALASYYLGGTLTLPVGGTKLLGDSGPDGSGTALRFAHGVTGVVMDGVGQAVEGLALYGAEPYSSANYWEAVIPAGRYPGVTVAAGASDADGIRVRHPTSVVRNCSVMNFGRDGVNASAGDQNLPSGIGAEDCEYDLLFLANNRGHGLRIQGGDANCSQVNACQFYVNQFWGVDNEAFLAGTFVAPQATENGVDNCERLNGAGDSIQAIASLVRSGNTVTLTWAAPYTQPVLVPGNGIRVLTCPDASFVGRWVVATAAPDNRSLTYTQVAPDASVTPAAGTCMARANIVPANAPIFSAVRSSNVVTLTTTAPVLVPNFNIPFRVGQGVTLINCPDRSFDGTFVVRSVSADKKTVTYAQTGPDASIASGTARMAFPSDLWQAAGLLGGAYYSPVAAARTLWLNPYAEGGQRTRFSTGDLIIAPVWNQAPDYAADWQRTPFQVDAVGAAVGLAAFNQVPSTVAPYDAPLTSYSRLGLTAAQTEYHCWQDPALAYTDPAGTIWKTVVGPHEYAIWHKDPTYQTSAVARLRWFAQPGSNATYINSEGGDPVRVNADPGTGPGLLVGDGTSGGLTTSIVGGTITPSPVADAAAPNGSVYLGSGHGNALCRKDAAGVARVIAEVLSGATASRPASPSVGTSYFDTTLIKPVWYTGANWVDSSGAKA